MSLQLASCVCYVQLKFPGILKFCQTLLQQLHVDLWYKKSELIPNPFSHNSLPAYENKKMYNVLIYSEWSRYDTRKHSNRLGCIGCWVIALISAYCMPKLLNRPYNDLTFWTIRRGPRCIFTVYLWIYRHFTKKLYCISLNLLHIDILEGKSRISYHDLVSIVVFNRVDHNFLWSKI